MLGPLRTLMARGTPLSVYVWVMYAEVEAGIVVSVAEACDSSRRSESRSHKPSRQRRSQCQEIRSAKREFLVLHTMQKPRLIHDYNPK